MYSELSGKTFHFIWKLVNYSDILVLKSIAAKENSKFILLTYIIGTHEENSYHNPSDSIVGRTVECFNKACQAHL